MKKEIAPHHKKLKTKQNKPVWKNAEKEATAQPEDKQASRKKAMYSTGGMIVWLVVQGLPIASWLQIQVEQYCLAKYKPLSSVQDQVDEIYQPVLCEK